MSVPPMLLGLLEREPSHGYDLKRDYGSYAGQGGPLRYSQVYATLSRLARDGKAVAGPAEQGGLPVPRPLTARARRGPATAEARKRFGTLGLDDLEGRRPGGLSGGQAHRVALARSLVARPEVLFADEPTGSLDSMSGELVMNLLSVATRERGTTAVVTHDTRVAAYADREIVVSDGKVSTLTGAEG